MKNIQLLAFIMVFLLVPAAAYCMEPLPESDMQDISAASGVAITIDDIVIHQSGMDLWYANQVSGADGGSAAIGLASDSETLLLVNALTGMDTDSETLESAGKYGATGNYQELLSGKFAFGPDDFEPRALTITVADVSAYDAAMRQSRGDPAGKSWSTLDAAGYSDAEAVIIGLPTIEISYRDAGGTQILMTSADNPVGKRRDDPDTYSFGTLYSGIPFMDDTLAILDGRIEIAPVEAVQ